jgi:hypothetical protein
MPKFHYVQRAFYETVFQATAPAPQGSLTRIATRLTTDTYVRSYHFPRMITRIDPSVSPPADEWWNGARVIFAVKFRSDGVTSAGVGPYDTHTIGTLDLYPRVIRDSPANALSYVIFEPIGGPLKLDTSRKGDGVNFPRIITTLWDTDHNGVFPNPASFFSVEHSITWSSTIVWASDSP